MTDFRQKCIGKTKLIGTFAAIPHPVAVEVTARSGARFRLHRLGACADRPRHDREHGPRGRRPPRAGDGAGARVTARRRSRRRSTAARSGVLVPRVSTAGAGARSRQGGALSAVRASAASGPGAPPATATASSNISQRPMRKVVVAVQVETAEGLANVDAIAATEGVDVVFVGPGDLSVSIDAMGPARRRRNSPRRSRRSSRPRWRTARPPASSVRGPRMSAAGRARARASSSWPATRCFSAPASRQAAPPRATFGRPA